MSDNQFLRVIDRMNDLIRRSSTGTPCEFAEKLNISESTLYKYLSSLKQELGAPIAYCRYRRTYYYTKEGNIMVGFVFLSRMEINKLKGGDSFHQLSSNNPFQFLPSNHHFRILSFK